jgi:hypothetical protein
MTRADFFLYHGITKTDADVELDAALRVTVAKMPTEDET